MRVLLSEEDIRGGIERLGRQINDHYAGRRLTIIGVLTGSVVLLADLIRRIDLPLKVGVVQTRSYRGGATSAGPLAINQDMMPEVAGRDVLLLDDIFDTGHTLSRMIEQMKTLGASTVRSAVLLRKLGRQEVAIEPDYAAFEIPNEFVVGYGLDYQDHYRHLPYVAVLDEADLAITH